jgi:hypothetical protein
MLELETDIYFSDLGDLVINSEYNHFDEDGDFENISLTGKAQSGAKYPVSYDALNDSMKEEVIEALNVALKIAIQDRSEA